MSQSLCTCRYLGGSLTTGEDKIAHCQLHASAPELLEALKNLLPIAGNENIAEEYLEEIEKAEAAIGKAEGKEG